MPNANCDIGLIGLAVMGQNLVLNMNDHGYRVAVFNRTVSKVDEFIQNEAKGTQVVGAHSIEELVQSLKRPRRVMLMVKAGDTVDQMIDQIVPRLEKGDILIDGGNSHYPDTNRRTKSLNDKGILYVYLMDNAFLMNLEALILHLSCQAFPNMGVSTALNS